MFAHLPPYLYQSLFLTNPSKKRKRSIDQSINQPTSQSINQSNSQSVNQSKKMSEKSFNSLPYQFIIRELGGTMFKALSNYINQPVALIYCVDTADAQQISLSNQQIQTLVQSINQSNSQSTNQPTNQSTNQSVNQSINQSVNQSINQSIRTDKSCRR